MLLLKTAFFCSAFTVLTLSNTAASAASQRIDEARYILYLPAGLQPNVKYPLVVALSPSADAESLLRVWQAPSERHKWIVLASKEFRNGTGREVLSYLASLIREIAAAYPVDTRRIVTTGISGGGMGAHAMALFYPDLISAVIPNTGMIHRNHISSRRSEYPKGKIAVFLASPTDFRYQEMKGDREFLESLEWRTLWIEFAGGHTFAPEDVYLSAAEWLESQWERSQ